MHAFQMLSSEPISFLKTFHQGYCQPLFVKYSYLLLQRILRILLFNASARIENSIKLGISEGYVYVYYAEVNG